MKEKITNEAKNPKEEEYLNGQPRVEERKRCVVDNNNESATLLSTFDEDRLPLLEAEANIVGGIIVLIFAL